MAGRKEYRPVNTEDSDRPDLRSSADEDDVSARWAESSRPTSEGEPAASSAEQPTQTLLYHDPYENIIDDSDDSDDGGENPSQRRGNEPRATPASNSFWRGLMNSFSRNRSSTTFADGVFGNLVAKDENPNAEDGEQVDEARVLDDNDDLTPPGQPPTYEEASADATPSYWESTLLAAGYGDEILVGEMPVGSAIVFILNFLLCIALGYFGFFLGYMFHTSHAGKNGSLVGLGCLMIASSQEIKTQDNMQGGPMPAEVAPVDPNSFQEGPTVGYVLHPTGNSPSADPMDSMESSNWASYVLLAAGIAMIVYACCQYIWAICAYYRIRRRQLEAEGNYESPRITLRQMWQNLRQLAHREETPASRENGTPPPPPGSPPLEPHQQHPSSHIQTESV